MTGSGGCSVDDLRRLVVDLEKAARKDVDARKLLQVEAFRAKQEWQQEWTGIRRMPHIARSVTYDTEATPGGATAEIGPDKGRTQGPFGHIVEFGTSQNPPIRPVTANILKAAADRLEKYLGEAGEDIL